MPAENGKAKEKKEKRFHPGNIAQKKCRFFLGWRQEKVKRNGIWAESNGSGEGRK